MSYGANNISGGKVEFTNEERVSMLALLQTGANTGGLQSMLMSGGPISADHMTALIAKLRELDTQQQMPQSLQDKFKQFEKTLDPFAQRPKDNAPDINNTLADFQLRQLLAVNGPTGAVQDMAKDLLGPSKVQAEVAGPMASLSTNLNPLQPQGPGLTLQNQFENPGMRMERT